MVALLSLKENFVFEMMLSTNCLPFHGFDD